MFSDLGMIVFDMDGTLVDSLAPVVEAMRRAFAAQDIAVPEVARIRRTIGLSLPQAMAQLVPDQSAQVQAQLVAQYKQQYAALCAPSQQDQEQLFSGAIEMLQAISQAGVLCAVATGKSHRGVQRVFQAYDLQPYFQSVQTADHHPSKPHPSMILTALSETGIAAQHCMMVGDTTYDMEMARNAGVMAVGVSWGYHETSALEHAGAQYLLHDWAEMVELAQRVL